jgi:hypothetical protein
MQESGKKEKDEKMANLWGTSFHKKYILSRIGDTRQLGGVVPFELTEGNEKGVRAARIYNAAGLDFTVVPDRGLSITNLFYKGIQVAYTSPVGTVHPSFQEANQTGWLRVWPGGFLTPCGLTQVGRAGEENGEFLGTHGRVAGTPARQVNWGSEWRGDDLVLWVEGSVREVRVFGENIVLRRKIWTTLGDSSFWIEDRVENEGFSPVPHMFLQHFNLGFPLISAQTRLELPRRLTVARDQFAEPGLSTCCVFSDPVPGYEEQVFYHDLTADSEGKVEVKVVNPSLYQGNPLGVSFEYQKEDFPILVEWKMMREGMYVLGIEPSICHVGGRAAERANGTLRILQPHESCEYRIKVNFF